jgi:hypothetical protein
MSERYVLAWTGDQHNGSTVALCPPEVRLDDGGLYIASPAQLSLNDCWHKFYQRVAEVRETGKTAKLYCGFNGDLTDGDHHGTTQILSGNPNAQAAAVNACMEPVLALKPDAMFFIRGTEAHVGKSASHEERIAKGLYKDGWPVQRDPATGNASWWHLKMNVGGVRIDSAHHGRIGQRPWTKANVVQNLAAEICYEHWSRGEQPPHLALRSHLHRFVDTYNAHPCRVIQMPAWQLKTAYVHKVAPETLADIGGIIVVIEDGQYTVEPVIFKPEPSVVWTPASA